MSATPVSTPETAHGRRSRWRRSRALALVLGAAALLRLGHWWVVRGLPFVGQLAMDSQEYDRWARTVAAGDWLGGEAFFQAPLYPYLLAVLYRLAGHRLDAVYLLQIVVAVAGLWALYCAGRRLAGRGVGLAAAALAAFAGPLVFHDVLLLKTSLAVSVAAGLLAALLAARAGGPGRPAAALLRWAGVGVLAGLLVLLRENALLALPFLLPVIGPPGGGARRRVAAAACAVAGLGLVLAPVALRNLAVSGDPLPTTFQGGVNLWIGNNPDADGTYRPLVPGKQVPALERREPVRLAEQALGHPPSPAEVSRYWRHRAVAWALADPWAFLSLQWRKLRLYASFYEWPDAVDYYWMRRQSPPLRWAVLQSGGLALLALWGLWLERRRLDRWLPVLLFVLGWTVSVVAFFVFSRYRLPVVPALALLAAVPCATAVERWRSGARRRAAGMALGIVAVLALSGPWWHAPRWDLVHHNLGRLAEERGDPATAEENYRQALEDDPESFLAAMNLGRLAAARGDLDGALEYLRRSVAGQPRSDVAWANLGAAALAAGRLDEAAAALDRALELNPSSLPALHNAALVALRRGDPGRARELNAATLEVAPGDPAARRLAAVLAGEAP